MGLSGHTQGYWETAERKRGPLILGNIIAICPIIILERDSERFRGIARVKESHMYFHETCKFSFVYPKFDTKMST